MELQSSCIIYSGKSVDFVRWEEYMADTGGKLCAMLERHGFSCVSFAGADDADIYTEAGDTDINYALSDSFAFAGNSAGILIKKYDGGDGR